MRQYKTRKGGESGEQDFVPAANALQPVEKVLQRHDHRQPRQRLCIGQAADGFGAQLPDGSIDADGQLFRLRRQMHRLAARIARMSPRAQSPL